MGVGNGFVENFVSQDRTEILRKVTHLCFNESGNLMYRKIFLHKERMSLFSVDFWLSADKIREGNHLCFERFLVSKRLMHKKGISLFSVEFCLSADKLRRGTSLCLKSFLVWQKLRDMRGVSRFSVEIFLSHLVVKFRRGAFLCFKKVLVSKIFTQKGVGSGLGLGGGHHAFVQTFLPHSAEKLRVENFWYGLKVYG